MPLTKEQKEQIVNDLTERMKAAKSVVFADFKGLSVEQISDLRAKMREQGASFRVAKKTLIRLAAAASGYSDELSDEVLEGSVGAAFSDEDEIAAAKIFYDFAKKSKKLELRGALFENRVLSVDETRQLAMLPGKDELLGKLVYLLKYPIQGFHGVLYNTMAGFVRALDAIREKQEQAT